VFESCFNCINYVDKYKLMMDEDCCSSMVRADRTRVQIKSRGGTCGVLGDV